jgi:hypothetical protein
VAVDSKPPPVASFRGRLRGVERGGVGRPLRRLVAVNRLRPVIAYLLFAAIIGVGLIRWGAARDHDRTQARRQICLALLEDRRQLADIIALAVPPVQPVDPNLPPAIAKLVEQSRQRTQQFLDRSQRRLSEPIGLCDDLHIKSSVAVHGATPLPVQLGGSTTSTSTAATNRVRGAAPAAPSLPSGPARPPRSNPTSPPPPPGTTTPTSRPSSPTSTTTTVPCVAVDGLRVCRG